MAFLDNSGDIILDAVLTDLGRELLAKGDGSFNITQFALADDEIDYGLYDKNHSSGSAYYDLEILQTPILESFTDNAAACKHKCVSFDNLELLFMPTLLLNEQTPSSKRHSTYNAFLLCADAFTEDDDNGDTTKGVAVDTTGAEISGFLRGETLKGENYIEVDQGIDNKELSPRRGLGEMIEEQYVLQTDHRLMMPVSVSGDSISPDYVDDDHIAFYTVSLNEVTRTGMVRLINDTTNTTIYPHAGPRGTMLRFKLQASMDVQTSTFLFERLGGIMTGVPNRTPGGSGTTDLYYIDTQIRIYGTKTGQSIDIPVRIVKYKS